MGYKKYVYELFRILQDQSIKEKGHVNQGQKVLMIE